MSSAKKRMLGGLLVAAAMLAVVGLNLATMPAPFAYAASVTPLAVTNPVKGEVSNIIPVLPAVAVTSSSRNCRDTRDWLIGDIAVAVDQGAVTNTLTLKLQHSNDNAHFTDGPTLVNASAVDTSQMVRADLYGAYTCLNWTVANTTPVTITARLLLHR